MKRRVELNWKNFVMSLDCIELFGDVWQTMRSSTLRICDSNVYLLPYINLELQRSMIMKGRRSREGNIFLDIVTEIMSLTYHLINLHHNPVK